MLPLRLRCALLLPLTLACTVRADDGAASIGAGGLIIMKREPRISMAKEVLSIGKKIDVSYEFRNDSDEEITTEIAFPIPRYELAFNHYGTDQQGFDDFKLWIDGQPHRFITETRAYIGKREVTIALQKAHIDIASFGHFDEDRHWVTDFTRLPLDQRKQLVNQGLFEQGNTFQENEPRWEVEKKYHWTQRFPPHAIVKIRHQYSPVAGYGMFDAQLASNPKRTQNLAPEFKEQVTYEKEFWKSVCTNAGDQARMKNVRDGYIYASWVDFILTTANTWKQPIEDFTLIVERPTPDHYVTLCWKGEVEKVDSSHFRMHTVNLVPTQELRVGFYTLGIPQ